MKYGYTKIENKLSSAMIAPKFSFGDGNGSGEGVAHIMKRISDGLYKKIDMSKTVDMFRNTLDLFAAGEFWGKLMRAASVFCECTEDPELGEVIRESMNDMLGVQKEDGEISCTPREKQPKGTHGSDLWERKYVLLGMLSYYKVFGDERVLSAMCSLADYTAAQVGSRGNGKTPITETGWAFCGIESSSILEPIVKLYELTGKKEYLTLARHIVDETGACSRENIFKAIDDGKSPYMIGSNGKADESIAKAYEMMSCFEGLVEYYRVTGDRKYLNCAVKFCDKLIEEEITVLGSGGADKPFNLGPGCGEQWNRTKFEQTNPDITIAQETCVTITWMKLCFKMLALTGDARYADEIEKSYENALLGALRPDGGFFDYFPLFGGVRGGIVNFTYNIGDVPLSCCTANGPAGIAVLRDAAVMEDGDGDTVILYLDGEYRTSHSVLTVSVSPNKASAEKKLRITVVKSENCSSLRIRIPKWASEVKINGYPIETRAGYYTVSEKTSSGDAFDVSFGRKIEVIAAPHGSNRAGDGFFALKFGASMLARDKRFYSSYDSPEYYPEKEPVFKCKASSESNLFLTVDLGSGHEAVFVDYASAGSTWSDDSEYRTWIKTKNK